MPAHVRVSGTWQEIQGIHARVGGTWQEIQEGWVRVSGVWQQFYSALTLNLANKSITDFVLGGTSTATVTFGSNGQLSYTASGAPSPNPDTDEWIVQQSGFGDGALFEVAYTSLVSGTGPSSGAGLGVYQALSSNRSWSLTRSSGGSVSGVWRFRVREIANTSNFVEADMSMSAEWGL